MSGWIGVDLDGTLASHEGWEGGVYGVGPPVELMCARVRRWLELGLEVRIFTARAGPQPAGIDPRAIRKAVDLFCLEQFGRTLPMTAEKDYACIEIWDDRAVQVDRDRGTRADGRDDTATLTVPGPPRIA